MAYIFMYVSACGSHYPERVQNGISGSYKDAVFKIVMQEESETDSTTK